MSTGPDPTAVARRFDERAASYDESVPHRWQAQVAADLAKPDPGDRVLDVATGTGLVARAVVGLTGEPLRVVGVDVSAEMLRVAVAASINPVVRADAVVLPFADGVFDLVVCVAAVPYLPDLGAAVREWRRVARPGATVVITTPAGDGTPALRLLRQAAARHEVTLVDPYADLGSADRIRTRLGRLGLEVEVVRLQSFPDSLEPDARAAYEHVLDYGFADRLRSAPASRQDEVFADFETAYASLRRDGTATHDVWFTRARLAPR